MTRLRQRGPDLSHMWRLDPGASRRVASRVQSLAGCRALSV